MLGNYSPTTNSLSKNNAAVTNISPPTDDPRASSNAAPPTWPCSAAYIHARGYAGFAEGLDAEAA